MKTLIFGAGPIGSLYGARLHQAGHDVTLLDRGERLEDLRNHGVVLEDVISGRREAHRVPVVDELGEDDDYDLIIVAMRKNQAVKILGTLAANRRAHTVLFLMNNPAGPDELVDVLGADRVMMGFPTSGGFFEGHRVRYVDPRRSPIPVGEVDGRVTERTRQVAALLESMPDKSVQIRTDMDAWLVTHLTALMANLGVYAAGLDGQRFADTRDAVVLSVRAQREALAAQRGAGIPIRPVCFRALAWIPEPAVVALLRRVATTDLYETGIVGHARAARDEIAYLLDEFRQRVTSGGVATESIDLLADYVDGRTPPMAEGSRRLSMHWGGVIAVGAATAAAAAAIGYLR